MCLAPMDGKSPSVWPQPSRQKRFDVRHSVGLVFCTARELVMSLERVETLIVGGGQAGLAMSHMLSKRGKSHVVLERRRVGERWRTERWDGLRFQFPNWSVRLPDFSFPHSDPDAFATSGEIVEYLSAYAEFI